MSSQEKFPLRRQYTQFHPMLYCIAGGFCLWLIASFWGFFGPGYVRLVLMVASLLIAAAVILAVVLGRISRWRPERRPAERSERFGEWLSGDFDAWTGRQRGVDAAVEALMPIAAVALGMSTFALILHLTV